MKARTTEMAIRVLVAVEHAVTRAGLVALLSASPNLDVVGSTDRYGEVVGLARERDVDAVVLSLPVPGRAALGKLVERLDAGDGMPRISVVYVSVAGGDVLAHDALGNGVVGYFQLGNTDGESLVKAISLIVHSNAMVVVPANDMVGGAAGQETRRTDEQQHILASLTDRETDVLYYVSQGLNNKEIGDTLNISEPTVKKHLSRALAKINQPNRLRAALFARDSQLCRRGYTEGIRR